MRTDVFDFHLPDEAIALRPVEPRDQARLLVVRPVAGSCALDDADLIDATVRDLPDYLQPGDAMVFNNTRVIPAALAGLRERGDRHTEIHFNLTRRKGDAKWRAFARPGRKLEVGDRVRFPDHDGDAGETALTATVTAKYDNGEVDLVFDIAGPHLDAAVARLGDMPLPPYIVSKRKADSKDVASYQTIYARHDGAVASPTAGLHFTPELLAALEARGIAQHFVTLHVGAGTFLPVKADDTDDHVMHSEWGEVSAQTADALNAVRRSGGRIVAVGTTSLRLLESAVGEDGLIAPWSGETDIFITPGYAFKAVDLLMTNFHLPRSTLFMLVSAFSGIGTMRAAYGHAIRSDYRFYSYGDASLLERAR